MGQTRPTASDAPELPATVLEQIQAMCLALPQVVMRVDESRSPKRSTAYAFDVRRRPFCLLIAVVGSSGRALPQLVVAADPQERDVLLAVGPPFFVPRRGHGRLGIRLTEGTNWDHVEELVTDSYRLLAPKKLSALLDDR